MKKKHRWLQSAIFTAQNTDVFLPWVMRRADKIDALLQADLRKKILPSTPFPRAMAAR
ncbi:MAG: hypothetical protein U5N55_11860 [Cypionkella sp.]|nr:hypothetical protein [Cypionkella sp.]